jgi:indolepyruvate ferredoxin oxidoreductase, beta subunit
VKFDLLLTGVGGQGVVSSATIISRSAMDDGWFVRQSEVHGMAKRGGTVQAQVRIADKTIESDLIPKGRADCILSLEPVEGLRAAAFLKSEGAFLTSLDPVVNIPDYPDEEFIEMQLKRIPGSRAVHAARIARETGAVYGVNMVLVGMVSPLLHMIRTTTFENVIGTSFERKGEAAVKANLAAFHVGKALWKNGTGAVRL